MYNEKVYIIIARTNDPRRKGNPHSKKRIKATVAALENDGYYVEVRREIV